MILHVPGFPGQIPYSVNLYWTIADRKLPFKNEKYLCLRTNL